MPVGQEVFDLRPLTGRLKSTTLRNVPATVRLDAKVLLTTREASLSVPESSSLPNDEPLIEDLNITVFAIRAAQHRLESFKGDSPGLLPDQVFKFRLTGITQPFVAVRGNPKFHCCLLLW